MAEKKIYIALPSLIKSFGLKAVEEQAKRLGFDEVKVQTILKNPDKWKVIFPVEGST